MTLRKEMERQALILPLEELARHAHVSIDNGHYCRDCFCCVCVDELHSRQRAWGDKDPYEDITQ